MIGMVCWIAVGGDVFMIIGISGGNSRRSCSSTSQISDDANDDGKNKDQNDYSHDSFTGCRSHCRCSPTTACSRIRSTATITSSKTVPVDTNWNDDVPSFG